MARDLSTVGDALTGLFPKRASLPYVLLRCVSVPVKTRGNIMFGRDSCPLEESHYLSVDMIPNYQYICTFLCYRSDCTARKYTSCDVIVCM